MEGNIASAGSPLVEYALIKAQREASKKGERLDLVGFCLAYSGLDASV